MILSPASLARPVTLAEPATFATIELSDRADGRTAVTIHSGRMFVAGSGRDDEGSAADRYGNHSGDAACCTRFRAMSGHARIMRIVEGACQNASMAHKAWAFDPRLARSIAKRAAGTLRELDPDALAPQRVASGRDALNLASGGPSALFHCKAENGPDGSATFRAKLRPLVKLLSQMHDRARLQGNAERATALRDTLSLLAALTNRVDPPANQSRGIGAADTGSAR